MKLAISVGLWLCFAASAAPPLPLHFHFETSESATAIYHLACLAGNIHCTKANFETYWHTKQTWTSADQTELDAWSGIFRKVADAALPVEPAPYIGNSAGSHPALATQGKLIAHAVESRSLPDFQGRVWQWVDSEDAARLYRAIAHFRARLHPSVGKESTELLKTAGKSLRKNGAPVLAAQMARFFGTEVRGGDVYFHAVPGPLFESGAATASPIANHIFIEVTGSAKPEPAASILLHELMLYFYDNAPSRQHAALMQQFAVSGSPDASPLYALLPDAIAVSVQAILAETSKPTDGEARDAFITRMGRSTTPVLQDALARNATLFQPGFAQAYIQAATRELGPDLRDPKFVLRSASYTVSPTAVAASRLFIDTFHPGSDNWKFYPNQNLVFLTAYDEWGDLPASIPELKPFRSKRGFAYISQGNAGRAICVLAGVDSAAVLEVVQALTRVKSLPVSGLILALD